MLNKPKLSIFLIAFSVLFAFGIFKFRPENNKITSFPDAEYSLDAEVLGANTIRFTNNSNKAIYELSVIGDKLEINSDQTIDCGGSEGEFEICLLKEALLPGENYLVSTNSSAKGNVTYFAKDAFDSVVVSSSI